MASENVIRERLRALNPVLLDLHDESAQHAGHAGARPGESTHWQLTIVKRLQPAAGSRAGEGPHAVLASRSSARSAWRARVSRDFTVPTATPSEYAISS